MLLGGVVTLVTILTIFWRHHHKSAVSIGGIIPRSLRSHLRTAAVNFSSPGQTASVLGTSDPQEINKKTQANDGQTPPQKKKWGEHCTPTWSCRRQTHLTELEVSKSTSSSTSSSGSSSSTSSRQNGIPGSQFQNWISPVLHMLHLDLWDGFRDIFRQLPMKSWQANPNSGQVGDA